jgi:hypothetical protein
VTGSSVVDLVSWPLRGGTSSLHRSLPPLSLPRDARRISGVTSRDGAGDRRIPGEKPRGIGRLDMLRGARRTGRINITASQKKTILFSPCAASALLV